jgi:acylphosphatase
VNVGKDYTPVRRHVVYRGHVQGVCFRAICSDLARRFEVVGYVRNLPDGAVELEAEGPVSEVERFLGSIARELQHHITEAQTTDAQLLGSEHGFQIRY